MAKADEVPILSVYFEGYHLGPNLVLFETFLMLRLCQRKIGGFRWLLQVFCKVSAAGNCICSNLNPLRTKICMILRLNGRISCIKATKKALLIWFPWGGRACILAKFEVCRQILRNIKLFEKFKFFALSVYFWCLASNVMALNFDVYNTIYDVKIVKRQILSLGAKFEFRSHS